MEDLSKLSQSCVKAQVKRLTSIPFTPTEGEVINDIMLALRDWCAGGQRDRRGAVIYADAQCKLVIDDAVRTMKRWRGIAGLKEIYDELFPPRQLWGDNGPLK